MEFQIAGSSIMQRGDPAFDRHRESAAHVHHLQNVEGSWLLWSLDFAPSIQASDIPADLSEQQAQGLLSLLQSYSAVLDPPTGVPT